MEGSEEFDRQLAELYGGQDELQKRLLELSGYNKEFAAKIVEVERKAAEDSNRIAALEERVKTNSRIIRKNRKNQNRTEIVIYAIIGFLVMVVVGIRFQDGVFSFAIPPELIAAIGVALSVMLKSMFGDEKDDDERKSSDNESDP